MSIWVIMLMIYIGGIPGALLVLMMAESGASGKQIWSYCVFWPVWVIVQAVKLAIWTGKEIKRELSGG